jgi:hypothetical protein
MRFVTAEQQIRRALHEFQMDFEAEQAVWQGSW